MVSADTSRTSAGVVVGIAANMTWGLAFLVPVLLAEFNPVAITVGRYLCYGLLSLVIALVTGNRLRYPRAVWGRAVLFAVTGNIGYYFLVVQGVELVGAPVVAVIIGTLPVTVALYGNWSHRDVPFRLLALPLVLIACGLVVVNAVEVDWSGVGTRSLPAQLLGVACALAALALWTWFGVANSTFLKANPGISSAEWSTVIGVVTLALSLVVTPVLLSGRGVAAAGSAADLAWWPLVVGSVVLGLLVSWGGTLLWNRASQLLPVSVAGQLIVFETISGLCYVFVATGKTPPWLEIAGIVLVLGGVLVSLRRLRQGSRGGRGGRGVTGARSDTTRERDSA
ncbi:Permease of the drug/metabolite transporter (DMT) superfamily [Streptoalloteichus tenebrarius]|uniref:Permease of the drug/metabolite transporter (DMT) superfamily n=1 Tax=Streptoalloteichus tenebrarius (strain ATCC 17920 / DSM 40477 / JCM 4838 / CBS 697.72 / NBRC 16177 / NCIMB 11028 / NRRL B-12390 / A12253. 1 / ISP 5477) TaxID=1933 RepID=A0ABT1HV73_STRSD|nr:DMT family transporter [Streptoalloteichus tenebrarius]MCP2259325.1 Permease of the drug/metabolite transporter (DMT) superfamily [Streptoalloteichus tenebrarius]